MVRDALGRWLGGFTHNEVISKKTKGKGQLLVAKSGLELAWYFRLGSKANSTGGLGAVNWFLNIFQLDSANNCALIPDIQRLLLRDWSVLVHVSFRTRSLIICHS